MSSKNFKNSGPTLGHFGDTPTPYTAQLENPPLASLAGREKTVFETSVPSGKNKKKRVF